MNPILKPLAVAGLAGAMAIGAMSASEARPRGWGAAGAGFVAGAVVGAAVANANSGYYYDDGYAYAAPGPGYYGPGMDSYASYNYGYAEPVYTQPRYYRGQRNNLHKYQGAAGTGTSAD